jgi:PAS domain S-box-containing protein
VSEATTSPIVRVTPADGDCRELSLDGRSVRCVPTHPDDDPAGVAERALAADPSCVVCEHHAGVDGLAVLRALRRTAPSVAVVLWTPEPDGAVASDATLLGADTYTYGDRLAAAIGETLDGEHGPTADDASHRGSDAAAASQIGENVLERIDDAFFAIDDDGRFSYVNSRAAALLAADPDGLVGRQVADLYDTPHAKPFLDRYEQAMDRQETVSFEEYFGPLDAWFEVSAYPDEAGLSVFFGDVTEQKRRERMLDGLLDTTRRLMAAAGRDAVADIVVEAARDVLDFDYVAVRLYDEETETLELVSRTSTVVDEMPKRPTYDADEGNVGHAFSENQAVETAVDLGSVSAARYLPLGGFGVISVGATDPAQFDDLRRGVLEVLAANATAGLERADRETTLQQYERVLETVNDMVYVLDEHGRVDYLTRPLADFLGYERETMLDEHPTRFITPADTDYVRNRIEGLIAGTEGEDETFEVRLETAGGELVPVQIDSAVLTDGDDGRFAGTVGVVRDISDLKRTREELEAENARFRNLFEHIPDPVAEARFEDGEPIVTRVNEAFERVFGYDSDVVVGGSLNDLIVPEAERDRARRLDLRSTQEPVVTEEVTRLTATGKRDFLFRGVSYERESGTRAGYAIYTDISDQKDRQRRLQVLHTVLRHNLRTELTLARGHADRLADETGSQAVADLHSAITEIENLSAKARTLERVVADETYPAVDTTDVVSRVRSVVDRCRTRYPAATIRADLPERADAIADYRLELAIENLVENSVDHASDGEPEIVVDVRNESTAVIVTVRDDGPGIPSHERALVVGERDITQLEHGSGLGLWIVATAVRSLGGELSFTDDAGGAAVELRLHPA